MMLRAATNFYDYSTDFLQLTILQISARSVRKDAVLRPSESEMAIYGILISSGIRFDIQKY
jgi:hypothetical protein